MSKKNKNKKKLQPIPKVIRKSLGDMIEEVQKLVYGEDKPETPEVIDDGLMTFEDYEKEDKDV